MSAPNPITPADLLEGGARVEVIHRDRSKELVTVRLLTIRQVQQYAGKGDDVASLAELFTGNKPGWADSLTLECVQAIVTEGERINEVPFASFVRFQKGRRERFERLGKGELGTAEVKGSTDGSPASASAPA